MKGEDVDLCDFTASYQHHIATVLAKNTVKAAKQTGIKKICLAGGVSANSFLRSVFDEESRKHGLELYG